MTERYLLDSNIFIEAENQSYPHEIFPGIWKLFETYAKRKIFFSLDKVYYELLKGHDFITEWAKSNKDMFVNSGYDGVRFFDEMSNILNKHNCPKKHQQTFLASATVADAFIVSYAKSHECTVVTREQATRNGFNGKVKIPDMCRELEVRCITMTELLKELKPIFILKKMDQ